MERFKRIVSFVLVLVMLVGMLPPAEVLAAETETEVPVETTNPVETTESEEESIPGESTGETVPGESTEETVPGESTEETLPDASVPEEPPEVTRAQWISALTRTFNMTVEDGKYPDNYFLDLSEESEYYYDMLLAVEFGVLNVPAGGNVNPDGAATRAFAASTLNFCLGYQGKEDQEYTFTDLESVSDPVSAQVVVDHGWLECVDGAFGPEIPITAAEMDTMMAGAAAIVAEDVIDADHENIVVLSDGVLEIPMGTAVAFVTDGILEITDCPVTLRNGSIFVVYNHTLPLNFKALAVEQEGNITRVEYSTEGAENALAVCDYEGIIPVDLSTFQPAEDVTYSIQRSTPSAGKARSIDYDADSQTLTASKTFKIADGTTSSVNMTITNLHLEVKNSSVTGDYRYVLLGDADVTASLDFSYSETITLGVVYVGGIGYVSLELDLSLDGTLMMQWTGHIKAGFAYHLDHGFRYIFGFYKRCFSMTAEVEVKLGIKLSVGLDLLVFKGSIYLTFGGKTTVKRIQRDREPEECLDYFSYLYAELHVEGNLVGIKKLDKELQNIYNADNSPYRTLYHYERKTKDANAELVSECTYGDQPTYGTSSESPNYNPPIIGGIYDEEYSFYYDIDDNDEVMILSYKGNAPIVLFPETLDGYPVAGIDAYAFYGNEKITGAVLPKNLKYIRASAFEGCTNLNTIRTYGTSLEVIEDSAFRDCTSLRIVELPVWVSKMGTDVFSGCTALSKLSFPSGLMYIPVRTFYGCTKLKTVVFPDTVEGISEEAFAGCTALTSINLGNVRSLGSKAFYNCTSLQEVYIGPLSDQHPAPQYIFGNCSSLTNVNFYEGITHIQDYLFQGCSGLRSLTLPSTVQTIGQYSFAECTGLKSVVFPGELDEIPAHAFDGCSSLTDVQFPEELQWLRKNAFANCTALEEITIPRWARIEEKYPDYHRPTYPFEGCTSLKTVTLASGARSVPCCLLAGCSSVETVILPDTVEKIEDWAFSGCFSLHTVDFGSSKVTKIGERAFAQTYSLETFVMPDIVVELGESAFQESGVQEVHLSAALESLGEYAFYKCEKLGKINIPASLQDVPVTKDEFGNLDGTVFRFCENLKEVILEEGLTRIPERLFNYCSGIEYIEIPSSVTRIEKYAFYSCDNLGTVIFHGEVEEIGERAFCNADVQWLDLPDGLKTLGDGAFDSCNSLKDVRLPDSLEIIGKKAFYDCDLTQVDLPDHLKELHSEAFGANMIRHWVIPRSARRVDHSGLGMYTQTITLEEGTTRVPDYLMSETSITSTDELILPDTVTEFGNYVFYNCKELTEVNLPDTVTVFGNYVFYNCKKLTEVNLPDSVAVLGDGLFRGCTALTDLEIPDSVTEIGALAFGGCTALETVKLPRNLKELCESVFYGCIALTSLEIPASVSAIGSYAFENCTALETVKLFGGLENLGTYAFHGCTALTALELPDSVSAIGSYAFKNCTALETVKLSGGLEDLGTYAFHGCTALTALELPDSVSAIGSHAFENCTSLKTVKLPTELKILNNSVFANCSALVSIEIPESVTTIADSAFLNCSSLTEVTLSEELETLGNFAFQGCTALEEITLPGKLKTVGEQAFEGCTSLKRVYTGRNLRSIAGISAFPGGPLDFYGVPGSYAEDWAKSRGYNFHDNSILPVKATGITWDMEDMSLPGGKTVPITVPDIIPANATSALTYTSSNPDVVSLDANMCLCAKTPGTAVITASIDDLTASFRVTVTSPMTGVKLDITEAALNDNETLQLTASCDLEGTTNRDFVWSSTGSAKVDQNGLVTATSKGTATITATAADGSGNSASCTVTVRNNVYTVRDVRDLSICHQEADTGYVHNYLKNLDTTLIYTVDGAANLTVVFHENTALSYMKHYLYFYDSEDNLIDYFTGPTRHEEWDVKIPGDTVKIRMVSDNSWCDWGYKVVDVIPEWPPCDHIYTSEQIGEPTCIKTAVIEHTCSLCGRGYQETVPALGHNYVQSQTDPTCTTPGYLHRICLRCGINHRYRHIQDPLGHSYEAVRTDPTCEEGGYTTNTCARCGDSYQSDLREPNGHSVSSGACIECGLVFIRIVTQPVGVTATKGETATVTLEAEGEELTYQWYYRNYGDEEFRPVNAFTGPVYSVEMSPERNGRQVYCLITDKNGYTLPTDVVSLHAFPSVRLEILSVDSNAMVPMGQQAEVTVTAAGEELSYEWYVMYAGDTEYTRAESVTGAAFSVTMTNETDGCMVYCIVRDWYGSWSQTETVVLSMEKNPLAIIRQPEDVWAMLGETAEVTLEACGDDLTYEWYFRRMEDTELIRAEEFTGPAFSVTMTPEYDGCYVCCTVRDRYGNEDYSNGVILYLDRSYAAIRKEPADTVVNSGETARICIEATGDGLTYEWYIRDPHEVYWTRAAEVTGPVYEVTVDETVAGRRVFCVVRDMYGSQRTSRTVTLSVPDMPVTILNHPMNAGAAKGDPAKVSVKAAGEGLTYEWYYRNTLDYEFHKAAEITGPVYTVTMSLSVDSQQVYCVVTDGAGHSVITDTAYLFMTTPPIKILAQPVNVAVAAGEQASVSFEVEGESLTYEWYYRDVEDSDFIRSTECTGSVYSVTMDDTMDGREVYCVAADPYGHMVISEYATLYLDSGNVRILVALQDVYAAEGETVAVTVVAAGDGLTYEWYVSDDYGSTYTRADEITGPTYSAVMEQDLNERVVYCLVQDQYGNLAHSGVAVLYLRREPVIIVKQPGDVTAAEGETVEVTVEATGDIMSYEWYYSRVDMDNYVKAEDVTGPVFTLMMRPEYDRCQVFCLIHGYDYDSTVSDTATLYLYRTPLEILTQPRDVTVGEGETAAVTVEAVGDGLSYTWYYRNPGDTEFRMTAAFTGPTYSVSMNAARDGRQIYCVIADSQGNTLTTDTVTLSLQSVKLEIVTQPQDVTVAKGETAAVTVEAVGEGLQYQWYFRNPGAGKFSLTTAFTGPTYSVSMSEARHGRQVFCVVTDAKGNSVTTDTVTLSMIVTAPEIVLQPQDVTVAEGETAVVTVEAVGEELTYEWYFRNAGGTKFSKTASFTGPSYCVTMSAARDGRQVYCVITDRYGNEVRTDTVTVAMVKNPVSILQQPVDVEADNGEPAVVTVEAAGDGLIYEWYFRNAGGTAFSKTASFTGPSYSVTMSAARNGRQVYCVITDAYGNQAITETVTLSMKQAPVVEIVTQPVDVTVAEGETAEAAVEATGDGLIYEWYFRNAGAAKFSKTTSFTGPSYCVTMSASRDGRQVYCVITDAYGNSVTTDTVTLSMEQKVQTPLEIVTQPEGFAAASGETGEITVEAVGDGLTYTWYYKNAAASKFSKTSTFTGPSYSLTMNASRSGRHVYCVITDQYGESIQTDIVTLNMVSDLELLSQPEDVTVASGKTAKVVADAVGEDLTYTWYFRNAGAASFTKTTSFTGDTYSLKMTEARTGREVYCVIKDAAGNTLATDIVALLLEK